MPDLKITLDDHRVPIQRWVLEIGRTVVETATTAEDGYEMARLCRLTPGATLYLELWQPVRYPIEMCRIKQEPVPVPEVLPEVHPQAR